MRICLPQPLIALGLVLAISACGKSDRRAIAKRACDRPAITIMVRYPGASPMEVESGVLLAVEEAVRAIDGLARVHSSARMGSAQILLELARRSDPHAVARQVVESLSRITSLPEEVETPTVFVTGATATSALIVVSGQAGLGILAEVATTTRDRLLAQPGVRNVELIGAPLPEIAIEIDPTRLHQFNLTLEQIAAAIRSDSIDLPGGALDTSGGQFLVRVRGGAPTASLEDLSNLVVAVDASGAPLRLATIASIATGYADGDRLLFAGEPAIAMLVTLGKTKTALADILATDSRNLPEGLRVELLGHLDDDCPRARPPARPRTSSHAVTAHLRLPSGAATANIAAELAGKLERTSPTPILTVIGADLTGQRVESAATTIELIAFATDKSAAAELAREWRKRLATLPGLESVSVRDPRSTAINIHLHHADRATLDRAIAQMTAVLSTRDELLAVVGPPPAPDELSVSLKPQARSLGVTELAVSRAIRAATTGVEAARVQRGRDEVRVVVRYPESPATAAPLAALTDMTITTPAGAPVALGELVDIEQRPGLATLDRIDGRRAATIVVTVDSRDQSPQRIAGAIADKELTALEKAVPGLSGTVEVD